MQHQRFYKLLSALFIVLLALTVLPVATAHATPALPPQLQPPAQDAVTSMINWTKAYDQATGTGAGVNITIPTTSTNRILVVGITATLNNNTGTVNNPTTITYGGQTLTLATGNGTTNGRAHTWLYYLKDNAVMDNTARPLNVTLGAVGGGGGVALSNMTVWYSVFAGVDQTPATYTNGNNLNNTTGSGPIQLSAPMAIGANEQAVYISSIINVNNATLPTNTLNANWTTGGNSTAAGAGFAWRNEVANRAIPAAGVNDNAATVTAAPANSIRYAISAMSLPPVTVSVTINQAAGQADPTNAPPINFTVVFGAPVSNFVTGDVTLAGTAGATTATVTGGPTTYNVAVTGMTGNGTVIATIAAGVASDASGNLSRASTSTDNQVTYDITAPGVTITQAGGQADPTGNSPINFTATFTEAVTGFINTDVVLSGTAGATTVTVTGGPTTYNVAVSGMTNSGTVIINIPAGVAQDNAGNLNNNNTITDNTVNFNLTVTVGDGTSPSNKTVAPNGPNYAVSSFTLIANSGTQTVTGMVVTGSGTGIATPSVAANGVKIWRDNGTVPNEWDAGDTLMGTTSFAGTFATFTGLNISVTNVSASYIITYSTTSPLTSGQTLLGAVTGITSTAAVNTNNDNTDATLTTAPWTILATAGPGGTIAPSGNVGVANNGNQAFKSTPSPTFILAELNIDGALQAIGFNDWTFTTVTGDHTITANFDGGWAAPTTGTAAGCTNANNAFSSDDLFTSCGSGQAAVYSNFNLNIPAGSIIDGIEVALESYSGNRDFEVAISGNQGNNYAVMGTVALVGGSTANQTNVVGNSTNNFGLTANTFFSNANFRIRLTALSSATGGNAFADQIQVKVHYREPTTLTVDPVTGNYGGTVNLTATLTKTVGGGAVSGQTVTFYIQGASVGTATTDINGVATLSNVNLGTLAAGTYNGVYNTSGIGALFAGTTPGVIPGYTTSNGAATLIVNQAGLTITANDLTKTYDSIPFAGGNGITYSGFLPGDTPANSTSGTVTYFGTSQGAVNQGTYILTPGGITSANYSITFVNGTLTINPAALTITAIDDSKTYDGIAYSGGNGVGYFGLALNDTPATALSGTLTYSGSSQGAVNQGVYNITPGGLTANNGNYTITFTNGALTINPATLTVTAVDDSKPYDGAAYSGGNGVTYSGFAPGESEATALTGTVAYTGSSQGAVNQSSYVITPGGLTANNGNYVFNYVDGALTINPLTLTVTAVDFTKTYDRLPYSGGNGVNYSGFIPGENAGNALTGTVSYSGSSQGAVNQGTYVITPGGLTANNGNYIFNYVNGTLTINPAALTVTANNLTKTYDNVPFSGGNGVAYAGFAVGDNAGNALTGTVAYSGSSQGAVNQGAYVITPGGLTANNGNYTITYANGTLTINPAALTVTAVDDSKPYDGAAYSGGNGVNYAGFAVGDSAALALTGTVAYSGSSQGAVNQGTYVITPGGLTANNGNYTITYVDGALTISPIALTVTAADFTKTYDGIAYSGGNGVNITGFIPGENAGNALTGTVAYSGSSQGAVNQGTYVITPGGLTANNGNYTIAYVDGALTINPAALTITANNASKTYDGIAYSGGNGVAFSGFAPGDNAANALTGTATYTGTSQGAIAQGAYVITPGGFAANNGNYTITYVDGTLTIGTKLLTITAVDLTKTYDGVPFSGGNGVTYTGFAPGDTPANSTAGTLTFTGTSQGAVNQGTYVITPGGITSSNYNIVFANGTLTIDPAALTITANDLTKTYDGVPFTGGNGVSFAGFVPGDDEFNALTGTATYGGTSQNAVNVGTYVITPGGFTANNGNYAITYANGALVIDPAALTITANNFTKTYDKVPHSGGNGVAYAGFVPGDNAGNALGGTLAYSGTSQGAVNQGTYVITPGGLTANNNNYTITFANGSLTIDPLTITVTAVPDTKPYDGNTSSIGIPLITGVLAVGDTPNFSQTFDTPDIGTNKTLTPGGIVNDGNGGGNYNVIFITDTNGVVAGIAVTVNGITANNKMYDGTNAATLNTAGATLSGVVPGDVVLLDVTGATGTFSNKNVGVGKFVTITGLVLTGPDAANYGISPVTRTANITPRTITVTAQTDTKVYDGTVTSTVIPVVSVNPIAPGDTANFTQAFNNPNVGTSKSIAPTGVVNDGNGGGNYDITFVNNLTGAITQRPITITADPQTKAFGALDPALTYNITNGSLAPGDTFSGTLTRAPGEAVGVYAIQQGSLTAGSNYNLTYVGANLSIFIVNQTITVITPAPLTSAYNSNFNVAATASSGLPVTITTTGVCTGGGSTTATIIMISGTGTCTIHYNQPGNANFGPALEVLETVTAQKANQTILVTTSAPASATYNTGFNVAATATSGLTVLYNATGVCTNVLSNFSMTSGTGTCTVQYTQPGDANYNAAPPVSQTVNALKANQSISVGISAPAFAPLNSNFTVDATASSGLPVTYTSAGACSNAAAVYTMTSSTGTCSVLYNQAGNANYNAAPQISQTTNAQKANQNITITTPAPASAANGDVFTVAASASSGLPVAITTSGFCTGGGTGSATITMTSGTGTCTIIYNQAGNASYNAALQVTESINSLKANQTITVTVSAPASATNGATFDVTAISSSGLPVTVSTTGVCTGGSATGTATITMTSSTGTCTVNYNQAGNANFNAAPQVTETTNAIKTGQTITVTTAAPANATFNGTFNVAAVSSSGLPVDISTAGSCSGAGTGTALITMTSGINNCTVNYNQAGNADYNPAPLVTNTTAAQKANQTINVTTSAPASAGNGSSFNVAATATSGLQVVISSSGACTGGGNGTASITINANFGNCAVQFDQPGNNNYNAAAPVIQNVNALPSGQTITVVTSAPAVAGPASSFNVEATSSSGLPVAITVTGGVCTVIDNGNGTATVTVTGANGTCTVHYNQAGDANFAAAPEITEDTVIDSTAPTVTLDQAAGQADPTNTSPIIFRAVFNEPVTGFGNVDVALSGTAGATTVNITEVAPNDGTTYDVAVSGMTGDGTIIASITAGAASDASGNPSDASTSTDNTVTYFDTTGPTVQVINTSPDTGDGVLGNSEVVTVGITQITVKFSQDVFNPAGDSDNDDVTNPNNFILVREMGDTAGFQTLTCNLGAASPADTRISVTGVTYDQNTHVATFTVNGGLPLSNGQYRLFVCGTTSIVDPVDNTLALVGNNGSGTDFTRTFSMNIQGGGGGGNGGGGNNGGNSTTSTASTIATGLIPVTGFAPNRVTNLPPQPESAAYQSTGGMTIEIPSLGVNVPIVGVNQTKAGGWDLTWLGNNVGYLNGTAYPTWSGNTVLTAHVNDAANAPGPFAYINELKSGDRIYIHVDGTTFVYQVELTTVVSPYNKTSVFEHEEYSWLTLVTCENYVEKFSRYTSRRIVKAVLISVVNQ